MNRNTTTPSYGVADRPVYELSFSILVLIVNCSKGNRFIPIG